MRFSANILFIPLGLAMLFAAGCGGAPEGAVAAAEGDGPPGDADAGKVIRVDLNIYTPGTIPQGIGEPVKEADLIRKEWEQEHSDARVKWSRIIVTGGNETEWLVAQLANGLAPEIVSQNAETAWPNVGKGWYVALDPYLEQPNPYVPGNEKWIDMFENQALLNAKRAPDGKLYALSIDIVETGLFYNKDILREVGYETLPDDWVGMMEALRAIQDAGYIPMTADYNLASDWGMDILFELLYHDILPQMDLMASREEAEGYLGHYLEASEAGFLYTKGFFTSRDPRWVELNRLLREWRTVWARELKNTDPIRLFLTERLAVYWSGSWFIRRMSTDPYIDFDWDVSYIPTVTEEVSPYGSGTPATVIGGAAVQLHITNSAVLNDNLDACVDFLMYLTAPENIERITREALVYIPNIKGVEMDERLEPFAEIFERRYCAMKWLESMDGRYKKYWRRMLDYYLEDGIDREEYLRRLERNFAGWVEEHSGEEGWNFDAMEEVWQERAPELMDELDPPAA
jgi:ABC-type glycerol-3-phosphate transport system substrate-binding protein